MKRLAMLAGCAAFYAAPLHAQSVDTPHAAAGEAKPNAQTASSTGQIAAQPDRARALPQLHILPPPGNGYAPPPPTGPLRGIGNALADHGIYLRALLVDEFAANTSGGQGRGHGNSLAMPFGTDIDLQKLVGWKGASFHMSINKSIGTSLAADHTGNAVSFQTRFKTFHNMRLSAMSLDQDLFDGKINVTGGRVSALTFFNASTIYCNFQNNSVCFNPAVLPIQNKALNFFPYGTWGGRVKVNPSKRFYAQIGAFEANPTLNATNGFDWSTKNDTGVQTAIEIGFQSASPLAAHAYHVRLGGFRNSSPVADPYFNTKGLSRVAFKGTPLMHQGAQSGWYAMGDVVLTRLGTDKRRNVTLFGGSIGTGEDYGVFKNQTILGTVVTGPFASRPEDTFGIVGSYIRLGDRQVDFLQASRRAAGGTDPVRNAEGIFEVNYGFKLSRGIKVNPNVQYVVNPDNILKPNAVRQSRNILAFGMRISIEAGVVLGLPVWR